MWLYICNVKNLLLTRLCGNKTLWKDWNQTFFPLEMSCFESFNFVVLILTFSKTNGLGSSNDLYARQNYTNLCSVPKKAKVWFDKLLSCSKKMQPTLPNCWYIWLKFITVTVTTVTPNENYSMFKSTIQNFDYINNSNSSNIFNLLW